MAYGFGRHRLHDDPDFFLWGLFYWLWLFSGATYFCNERAGFGFFQVFFAPLCWKWEVGVRLRLYFVEFDGRMWSRTASYCVRREMVDSPKIRDVNSKNLTQ